MKQAVVTATAAPLYAAPGPSALLDEVLFGSIVQLSGENQAGFLEAIGPAGTKGYTPVACLRGGGGEEPAQWAAFGKTVARAPFADISEQPSPQSPILATLPRGGLVHPISAEEDGWLAVGLPGGEKGYVRAANFMPQVMEWAQREEKELRQALATSALSYLGTQYRAGGRTAAGIDAVGLVGMAYQLNGILLPGTTTPPEGTVLSPIAQSALAMGDLIYFPGHVAMFLGDGQYVHASPHSGSDAVVINSLVEDSPFYRPLLAQSITACLSLFA